MSSTSLRLTSVSAAVSDSHRISLRIVKSRRWSRVKSRSICLLSTLPKQVSVFGQVFANVDLLIRIGDLVDDLPLSFRLHQLER